MIALFILSSIAFSQLQRIKSEHNNYLCFQKGNSLCPIDQNYQIFHESQKLTEYLLNNIYSDALFNVFIANTKQEIIFLNCSLLPNKVIISGYPDSYAYIDFKYGYNSDKTKRNQNITVENIRVKSLRSETKKNQNKVKAMSLKLLNVNFINDEQLTIDAKEIAISFNSLNKVAKVEGDKIVRLFGLPKGGNNEDLNLKVFIESENLILESFNDNASIDFLSSKKSSGLYSLLQFKSFKNSLITLSSQKYNIFLNYETYLSFYYDISDLSSIVSLSKDLTRVNVNVECENAHVIFSDDKWPSSKTLKHHDSEHHSFDHNSINFDLTCKSNVEIKSSAQHLPLNVNSCKNPHLIFNDLSSSINSLELTNDGNAIIENLQRGGEVSVTDHITFSPGSHLYIDESVSKLSAHHIKSEFKTHPTQMSVDGHFEIGSGEFEILEYPVSFEYSPFSQSDKVSCFIVPANKKSLMPIEIRKPRENCKFNVRLSDDFLKGSYNELIQSSLVGKSANLFVNMDVNNFQLFFRPNKHSKREHYEWNDKQKSLVSLVQHDKYVSLRLSSLPSLFASSICLYRENDAQAEKLCERENLMPVKVPYLAVHKKSLAKVSEMTKATEGVSIFLSSSDITLNLDELESASVQSASDKIPSFVTIDNGNNHQNTVKSLSLKDVEVSFNAKSLKYNDLTLDHGTKINSIESVSFKDVNTLNADVTIMKQIKKIMSSSNDSTKNNFIIFGNILQSIKFIQNGFIFYLVQDNEFEVDAEDYNVEDYPFIYNESNITLFKDCFLPSPINISINYDDFYTNNFFIIVDSSFDNDNIIFDINFDAERIRLLTYSSVIPFKFSSETKEIQVALGQYENVREVDFLAKLTVDKEESLTLSPVSEETDELVSQNNIHIIFDYVTLNEKSSLISNSKNFVFPTIYVSKDSSVQLEGVTGSGEVFVEGRKSLISIKSSERNPSNFANSNLNVIIRDDLFDIVNSVGNSPIINFDWASIENSVKSIKLSFKSYNRSLLNFPEKVAIKKLLYLASFESSNVTFQCSSLAEKVVFTAETLFHGSEYVRFRASCDKENDVYIFGEFIDETQIPTPSFTTPPASSIDDGSYSSNANDGDDDNDGDTGVNKSSKKKRNRIIALACAAASAVIIIIVAVSVALYLRKHYKEEDTDKANNMMEQLNPNGERDVII